MNLLLSVGQLGGVWGFLGTGVARGGPWLCRAGPRSLGAVPLVVHRNALCVQRLVGS